MASTTTTGGGFPAPELQMIGNPSDKDEVLRTLGMPQTTNG
jgi:hypothetical protein